MAEGYNPTGYGRLSPDETLAAPIDYDLFGEGGENDLLLSDRLAEKAHLAGAALFPERTYMQGVTAGMVDFEDEFDALMAERRATRGERDA